MWRLGHISFDWTRSAGFGLACGLFTLQLAAQIRSSESHETSDRRAGPTEIQLVLQTGHRGGVHGVAFSPRVPWDRLGFPARWGQGEILASGGNDGDVLLWDSSSGLQVRTLSLGNGSSVGAVAFRGDGRQIAATGGATKIWSVASGALLHSFENEGYGRSIVFSRDGRYLAVATDKEIVVWDIEAGEEKRRFGMQHAVLAFGKGSFLAGAASMPLESGKSVDLTLPYYGKVWDVETGAEVFSVRGDTYYARAISFGPDNSLSIWGSGNCVKGALCNSVHVWTIGNGVSQTFRGPGTFFTAAGFCPDNNFLLGGTNDGKALLWNVSEQKAVYESDRLAGAYTEGVDCSVGQATLAASEMSGRIIVWNPASPHPDRILYGSTNEIDRAEFVNRSSELLQENRGASYSKGYLESATIWEATTDGTARYLPATLPVVTSADGEWQLFGTDTQTLMLADRSGAQMDTHVPSQGTIVALSPSAKLAATAREQRVTIWTLSPWRQVITLPEIHKFHVEHLAFNPGETMLAVADDDGTVSFWDTHSWQLVRRLGKEATPEHAVWTVAFNRDGTKVAWGGNDRVITISDTANWKTLQELSGHQSAVHCVAFSPTGAWLASAGWDGTVRLWPLKDGQKEKILFGHDWLVNTVAFNSKGNLLASAGLDGTVRLWDIGGNELATLVTFRDRSNWLVTTPEGLFDGSASAGKNIFWRTAGSNELQPLESYYTDYFYPGLLAEVVVGARPRPAVDISAVIRIPGLRVELRQKRAHLEIEDHALLVCFDAIPGVAVDAVPGDAELPAEVNGFRVVPESKTCKYQKEVASATRTPEQLKAELEKWASDHFVSAWDGKPSTTEQATLYVLTIGINQYAASEYSELPYAETSAKTVHDFFESRAAAHLGYANMVVDAGLYGPEATRKGIVDKLNELSGKVRADDVVLVYLAGHGTVTTGQEMFYFVPFDGQRSKIQESGLDTATLAESVRKLPAKRLVLIIDACESGGALDALTKIGEVKARVEQRRIDDGQRDKTTASEGVGVHLIAAALPLAYAIPAGPQQSALVTTLLAGLRERGRGTVGELVEYVNRELPDISEKDRGFRQVPLTSSIGLNFPLVPPESHK